MHAVIFDVEGTLVNCVPETLQCWQESLARFGLKVPIDVLQLYSGMDGDEMLQIIAPHFDARMRARALAANGAHYRKRYLPKLIAFGGVRPLFEAIKSSGSRIALATGCAGHDLARYRRLLDVDDLIDGAACEDDVAKGKPAPAVVLHAAERLQMPPQACVVVGDSPYDAEAATSAGMAALGLATGGFADDVLIDAGCFAVATDLLDAGRLLEQRALMA